MSGAAMAQFLQSGQVNCKDLKQFSLATSQRLKCSGSLRRAARTRFDALTRSRRGARSVHGMLGLVEGFMEVLR
jgi:hypothetical protein